MTLSAPLGYLGLEVGDLAAWRRFATEILGLGVGQPRSDGALPLRMDDRSHRFLLQQGPADDLAFLGWEVPDAAALQDLRKRLAAAGVAVAEGSADEAAARGVAALIHCRDPNGLRCEFFHGLESGAGPFRSAKVASGYLTAPLGLGHVLLAVDDKAASEAFWLDVLGFRLSDSIETTFLGRPLSAVFLHVNPRHHSLAFAAMPGPKRLNHFMLEVNALDDVGAAYDRCQDQGVPIALSLGRHPNDRMVSFYGVTPAGFLFEVGWGARQVDDATWEIGSYTQVSEWGHRPMARPPGA
jgi:2,3-dihydroxybiphenyl 1,2-dioxygenase